MSFADLEFDFHFILLTLAVIIKETCRAAWEVLQPLEMREPDKKMWLTKVEEFYEITNFPNCIGVHSTENISKSSVLPILDHKISIIKSISQ